MEDQKHVMEDIEKYCMKEIYQKNQNNDELTVTINFYSQIYVIDSDLQKIGVIYEHI